MSSKKEFDAATGKASFDKIRTTLQSLPADALMQPNLDLQSAALAALVLVDRARQGERAARFALLPDALFPKSSLDDLEHAAHAASHVEIESTREETASTGAKVDLALVQEASALRERMLKTADYNLGHVEEVGRELADIRQGTGYLDLANDLSRLAVVYAASKSELASDKRHYDVADAGLAAALAQRIRGELRASASRSGAFAELRPRAFTELTRLYNEVRAAAQFVFRAQPDVLAEFPSLRASTAALAPARRAKKSPEPPAPTNGDGAPMAGGSD